MGICLGSSLLFSYLRVTALRKCSMCTTTLLAACSMHWSSSRLYSHVISPSEPHSGSSSSAEVRYIFITSIHLLLNKWDLVWLQYLLPWYLCIRIHSGVYGILCILGYDFKWNWDMPTSVIQRVSEHWSELSTLIFQALSSITALGHTIAKYFVCLNRYFAIRHYNLSDVSFICCIL